MTLAAERPWRRMAGLVLAASACCAAACEREPRFLDRRVVVHAPRACPVSQERGFGVFYAGGDFDVPDDRPAVSSSWLGALDFELGGLPARTASLRVLVSQPPLQISWTGAALRIPAQGAVNVLVWPDLEACRLSRDVEAREGETFGVFGTHLMVLGGRVSEGAPVPPTYVGDLTTGIVDRLPFGVRIPRAEATVTTFDLAADGVPRAALVAGGETPEGTPLASAEVYLPDVAKEGALGDFDPALIDLSAPRTRHAAVVLTGGETLLVGGRGPGGVLRSLEVVDPVSRRARTERLATLAFARERATALRLASGEILVAGGLGQDGRPVPYLEWLAPDGSPTSKPPRELVTGRERAFIALDGGGALAVIAPESPAPPDFRTVWVISANGVPEPGLAIDPVDLPLVRLFDGPRGAPLLFTGRRWMRWQPWFSGFQTLATVTPSPALATPEQGPGLGANTVSGAPGLALWTSDRGPAGTYVMGYRFDARTPFDPLPNALLVLSADGLAPDRLSGQSSSAVKFSSEAGLELGAGASAFVTDLTFADFDLSVDVAAAQPLVVLRPDAGGQDFEVGGAACAFAQRATEKLSIRRRGEEVRYAVDDGAFRSCTSTLASGARIRIGLRGAESRTSTAKNLSITRR